MADDKTLANAQANRERFRAFLDESEKVKERFEQWELTLLGGFGGYQRQAPQHTTRPAQGRQGNETLR